MHFFLQSVLISKFCVLSFIFNWYASGALSSDLNVTRLCLALFIPDLLRKNFAVCVCVLFFFFLFSVVIAILVALLMDQELVNHMYPLLPWLPKGGRQY